MQRKRLSEHLLTEVNGTLGHNGARRDDPIRWRSADRIIFEQSMVKEGEKYRLTAQRLRDQAERQHDHAIGEQYRKIADRYDELAKQVEASARRSD